jgi:hypothetical protein
LRKRGWSPTQREAASIAAKARLASTPGEVLRERLDRGRVTYAARYPWKVEFRENLWTRIASGDVVPEPCQRCGAGATPSIIFDDEAKTGELVGWHCYSCRRAIIAARNLNRSPSASK